MLNRRSVTCANQAEETQRVVASELLQELYNVAPKDHVTLGWILERVPHQSFGLTLLLLAIAAFIPGICTFAGLLLIASALQMIAGRSTPFFPRWISEHRLPNGRLGRAAEVAIKVLRFLETVIHPRWVMTAEFSKRVVGVVVLILAVRLVLAPPPLSNILPAVVLTLISVAYVERDGLLLSASLLAGLGLLASESGVVLQIIHANFAL